MSRRLAAEAIGTFFLVLIGPGSAMVNTYSGGTVGARGRLPRLRFRGDRHDLRDRPPLRRARPRPRSCYARPSARSEVWARDDPANPRERSIRSGVAPFVRADVRNHGRGNRRAGGGRVRGSGGRAHRGILRAHGMPVDRREHESGAIPRAGAGGRTVARPLALLGVTRHRHDGGGADLRSPAHHAAASRRFEGSGVGIQGPIRERVEPA